ncbi:MAG TPA: M28 family peptidase [Vicinamibacterales bacterium]|jgi:Peptidase family M28|nr:M28 family peptidase [Vicinamibacterales bacterium]
MRRILITVLLIGAAAVHAAPGDIDADRLLDHIKFLASDDLKGRASGSPELERAAEYIAQQFRAIGLRPGGDDGSWFQPFELIAGVNVGAGNSLVISDKGRSVKFSIGSTYYPLSAIPNESPNVPSDQEDKVPLVFAGYGLVAPERNYDDYAGINVNGKAVLIFSHEPQENDANSPLNGNRPMPQTTLYQKAAVAHGLGARVLIVVGDATHSMDQGLYHTFHEVPDLDEAGMPVLRVRRAEMQPLLDAWGLDALARQIDLDLRPRSRLLKDATIDYMEFLARDRKTVRNVVGVLPGSDPVKAREAIVIGAHYDHVGLGGRLSMTPERAGEVHNGADDNASGTASIIEVARAAMAERARFPRTLIFVTFAGEERGLLGSMHYVASPPVSMGDTIAMLNLDMVGRSHGSVDVSGLDNATIKGDLMGAAQAAGSIDIKQEGPGAGRSDDSSFLAARVPAVNFFTGFHPDYHRPTDDWQKIDKAGTARVAALALEFAARLAADDRLTR